MKRMQSFLAPAALALLLAACGGGGGVDVSPPVAADPLAEVPASASQSAAGFAGYVNTLTTLPAESREPVAVESFNPLKAEDTEPEPIACVGLFPFAPARRDPGGRVALDIL